MTGSAMSLPFAAPLAPPLSPAPTAPRGARPAPLPSDDLPLVRARTLIAEAIHRRWAEGLLARDPDGVFTSFLGASHVERLMEGPSSRPATPPSGAAAAAIVDWPAEGSLGRLSRLLRLTPGQADLVALLLACETDPGVSRLTSYLGGNQSQFGVTLDLVFEAVYRGRTAVQLRAAAMLHADLADSGALRRLQVLLIEEGGGRAGMARCIRLQPRVLDYLVSGGGFDPDLAAVAELWAPVPPEGECGADDLRVASQALAARDRLLHVEGPPGSGCEILLRRAAAELGRPLLLVDARGLAAERVVGAFREAVLQSALLALHGIDQLAEGEALNRLRECLTVFPETLALVGSARAVQRLGLVRPLSTIRVAVPSHGDRLQLWARHLGAESGLGENDLRQIAGLYNLGVGGIVAASAAARESAGFSGVPLSRSHVVRAVRQLFDSDLSTVATRVEVCQTWEDVVLPEDLADSVRCLIDRIELRGSVLGDWGFARKLGKGLGLSVLFSGEPGTGKSMVAGLIARDLGLDLYVVDLSRITSKWLGETEKNLARAFDAAEAGHVLLLFDEADSVLGKRSSDARTANDRHANLETNFILARLEQFQGIAIFTTNLSGAIDPAIGRRMAAHLKFPFPDAPARAEMWRRMLPLEAPVAGDIDFQQLSERFEITGGFIRNIVVRAAYLAARQQQAIAMAHLEWAGEQEYRERGSLLLGGRLE